MLTEITEYSYPQEDLDHEPEPTKTSLQVYHAPFSLLHLESQKSPQAVEVNFKGTQSYFLPLTKEIEKETLEESIEKGISFLTPEEKNTFRRIYQSLPKDRDLYGEYLPQTTHKSTLDLNGEQSLAGRSVDSMKYVTNFLLQKHLEKNGRLQEIVFHPDILYFSSQGRIENIPTVLNYFNSLARVLKQKIFIENLSLSNRSFQEALGLFQKPKEIYNMLKPYSNFGVVVDLQHLEKSGEGVLLGDIKEILPERLIIHSREGYKDKYKDVYLHAAKNAIPWVVEE